MADEEQFTVRAWGVGYWRWQCLNAKKHGCSGIVGPPFGRADAEAAAAQHRADVHEGLMSDMRSPDRETTSRRTPTRRQESSVRGIAHGLVSLAERASQRRRSDHSR